MEWVEWGSFGGLRSSRLVGLELEPAHDASVSLTGRFPLSGFCDLSYRRWFFSGGSSDMVAKAGIKIVSMTRERHSATD
jgi:hypothetical protein